MKFNKGNKTEHEQFTHKSCAVWAYSKTKNDTGSLHVMIEDRQVSFNYAEAQKLVKYLAKVLGVK